jgi:hypothetical protein
MYIAAFITITLATVGIMTDVYTDYLIPIPGKYYSIFFVFLFFLYMIYRGQLQYHFISFSDEGNKIILRYYRFSGISQKYRSFEILKSAFYTYEIHRHFFGRRAEMVLFQRTPKGIAKYPPVPLTALTPAQLSAITQILSTYATKGK